MKAVILAGGLGTRLSEETVSRPKPMVNIGGWPMLWHIMKIYQSHGVSDFVICCGYKGYMIKEYFANYALHTSDVTFDMAANTMEVHESHTEPWRVTIVDTGADTMTGGRVKRIAPYVDGQTFMLTYGDGVADVDISALLEFHKSHGKLVTVTSAQPMGRFGALDIGENEVVRAFQEKPVGDSGWINAGFFVMEPGVFDYIEDDSTILERQPLENLATEGELLTYRHRGFWLPMDTLRDKEYLESLWASGQAQWKVWDQ